MSNSDKHYAGTVKDESELGHPEHRALFDHWQAHRRGEGVPLRSSFDPLQFHRSMPRMAIIERSGDAETPTFRYRLAGTEIARRAGRDPTGKRFDELYEGTYLETANQTYRDIAGSGQAHFSQRVYPIGDGDGDLRYDRLILPYSSDGSEVDQFVLLIVVVEQTASPRQDGSFSFFGRKKNS